MEGLRLIHFHKNWQGAILLAMGINIKIIPLLALFYLFFKGKFNAIRLTIIFLAVSLLLPSLFIGHQYNMDLLQQWKKTISPAGEKYVFENNNGCQSLNAVLPAYFFLILAKSMKPHQMVLLEKLFRFLIRCW